MPQLVSDNDVKQILDTTINTQPFIQAAVVVMDGLLSDAGYTTNELMEIQRWMSAHFAVAHAGAQSGQKRSESYEGYSVSYAVATLGDRLDGTHYGKVLQQLEYKGILAGSLGKQRATFSVH